MAKMSRSNHSNVQCHIYHSEYLEEDSPDLVLNKRDNCAA